MPGLMKRRVQSLGLAGFTLIETLVALTIVTIMLGLVVANFGMDDRQQLQQESHRLALLMRHASETARTTGQPLAWANQKNGYRFLQRRPDRPGWQPINNDSTLRQRQLPQNIRIAEQNIEGNRMATHEMIVFSPSGLNPPFSLTLATEHASARLVGNLLGTISEEALIDNRH